MKYIKSKLIILLIFSVLLTSSAAAWAANPLFSDVKENHWAKKSIEEISAAGIINGYPDGTFKPNDPVSRLHTIFMLIRIKNLGEKVEKYDLSKCSYEFPPNTTTESHKKHLAVAVDEGWLVASGLKYFNPKENANRQEVASMIALAFNLRGNYDNLPFVDKDKIYPGLRSYVAGVYEAGLINGRTATTFSPLSPVKRSELATIFARMIDLGIANPNPGKRVEGYFKSYNSGNIVIADNAGNSFVYTLSPNAAVYYGSSIVSPDNLLANQLVRLYLDDYNRVSFIKTITSSSFNSNYNNDNNNVNNSSEKKVVWGQVKELTVNGIELDLLDDDKETYKLDEDIKVYDKDGDLTSLLSLTKDAFIKAELENGKIEKIHLMDDINTLRGKIIDIKDDEIEVAKNSSSEVELEIDQENIIVLNDDDNDYDYEDLQKGYMVEVTYSNDEALKIKVLDDDDSRLIGTIYSLHNDKDDEDDWELTLLDVYGDKEDYDVDEDVDVYDVDGDKLDFYDLDEDDKEDAVIYLNNRGDVEKIELVETYDGTIQDLDEDDIEIDDGSFDLASSIDISYYLIGSEVKLYVHNDEVIAIEVTEDEDDILVPGEVYSIDDDNWKITIEQDSDNRFAFNVDEDVEVYDEEDDENIDFDDIEDDWEVQLELDDGKVVEITVKDK
ncbi:MAG: S-layer homology domain-containing protein [Desulfotomaculum sp.]|nr:S-layer homology domain-containing protein [Desulfotomaculum sp.]